MSEVKRLRARTGMSQRALARAAETSQPTISAYEGGRKAPTITTLRRLAEASGLEMSVQFLTPMTREDRRSLALHEVVARRLEAEPVRVLAKARANLRRMRDANPGPNESHMVRDDLPFKLVGRPLRSSGAVRTELVRTDLLPLMAGLIAAGGSSGSQGLDDHERSQLDRLFHDGPQSIA